MSLRCLVFSLAVLAIVGCSKSPSSPGAGLSIVTPQIELVADNDAASSIQTAVIRVKNDGKTPVSIAGINFGCSCVDLVSAPDQPIAANGVAEIQLKAHLPASGEQVVRITITTTPPSTVPLLVELKLRGRSIALPQMGTSFPDVRFSIPSSSSDSREISLQTWEQPGSTPCLQGFKIDSPRCRVTIPEPPFEMKINDEMVARSYRVRVEADGGPEGLQTITITPTLDPAVPGVLPFRVTIESPPLIRALPNVLNVSAAALPLTRQILITSCVPDWTCKPGQNWPDWVTTSSVEEIDGETERTFRIVLQIDRPTSPPDSPTSLSFAVSGIDTPSIAIPIYVD